LYSKDLTLELCLATQGVGFRSVDGHLSDRLTETIVLGLNRLDLKEKRYIDEIQFSGL